MTIMIKNGILVSMDEQRDKIEDNTDILIQDNKIIKIDKNITCNADKIIDATGKVVMPGLINTHAHVPMSIFRETLDGYSLQDWLTKKIWPMESKLNERDVYYASYLTFLEMIKTGTTTVNDMYFYTDKIIEAMKETGIRLQTTVTLRDNDDEGQNRFNDFQNILKKYYNTDSKLSFNAGIHGFYTASSSYVDQCLSLAKNYNLNIHTHFCENETELEDIKTLYKKSPIEVLQEKSVSYKPILAHCVYLTKEEIDILKKINASVAHCPVSNLKLGCGIANITYMNNIGVNVTLGTDGQGSGCNMDLFEAMKYTGLLQKGITKNPESLPSYEILKMATINGAKALGLDDKIGSITENKIADLIIIDIDDIKIKPVNNLLSELVYNVKGSNVSTTIIDGNILMEEKKLLNNHEQEIALEVEKIYQRIAN